MAYAYDPMAKKRAVAPARPKPAVLTDAKVAALKPPLSGREEHRDLKVTGLRLRVGTSGKTWIVRARAGSKVINKKLGTYPAMGLAAARAAAEKLLEVIARTGDATAVDRTFGAVAEAWIEKAKSKNKGWKLQERRLELHVLPKWRDRKIASLRRSEVRDLIEGLEGDTLPNAVLALVRPIFRFALARDWIEVSPAEGIEKPNPVISRDRVLSMSEIARVWRAAEMLGFPFRQFIQTLILTGQRRTEVASMRWENVDLESGAWILESSDNKSSRTHLVPLASKVVAILKEMPKIHGRTGAPRFAFTSDGDTHLSSFATLKNRLDAFLAVDGGEPMKPWVFHDVRRSAANHLVRLGVLEEVVDRILNHAPQGVTAKVYALHRYEPEKRDALEKWAAEVDRALKDSNDQATAARSAPLEMS